MPVDTPAPAQARVARVLLDSGLPQLDHLFDYRIPEELRASVRVGQRVKVPFRSQRKDRLGFIVELTSQSEFQGELASLSSIVSPIPMLQPEVWRLARRAADRAGGSAADLLRLAVPKRHVSTEHTYLDGQYRAQEPDSAFTATEHEREQAEQLVTGARVSLTLQHPPVRLSTGEWVSAWAETLARTARAVHAKQKSVIIVAPDFRDLDQLDDTLTALGSRSHIRLDSRQTASERYLGYLRALEASPRIIIGNRSIAYAPAHALGAILIWCDADPLLSEPRTPYVHARDAALIRAEQTGAGLLFASHTPSAETLRMVGLGYFSSVHSEAAGPKIMHSGSTTADDTVQGRIPELATRMLRQGLQRGPVLVQVAGPGYVPVLVCATCGDLSSCHQCTGPLQRSRSGENQCRWCGNIERLISCRTCHGTQVSQRGAGSELTAEQFSQIFPETKVVISDGQHYRGRVDARPSVVVATRGAEPIAAGGYTAVALLDVDRIVTEPSLRSGENALRWWHGATSLAAQGAPVVITGGAGPVVRAFVTGRERDWLDRELQDRKLLRFPPAIRVATVTGAPPLVQEALSKVTDLSGVDVLGPTPLADETVRALVRFPTGQGDEVAGRLRATLVAQAASQAAQAFAAKKHARSRRKAPPGALRLKFDDPLAFDDEGEEEA